MTEKRYLLALIAPVALVFVGCGTPEVIKAAQNFAKLQEQSAVLFPKIANDAYQTCIRSASYVTLNVPPISVDNDRAEREKICENPKTGSIIVKKAFQETHNVINAYLVALGQLAADEVTNFNPEVKAVGLAIQKLPGLGEGEKKEAVEAGTSLADFLLRIFVNSYRRKKLKEAIVTVDPYLTTLVIALDTSVERYYLKGLLDTEREALDGYYRKSLGFVLTQPEGQNVAIQEYVSEELNSAWIEKQAIIREKKELASQYLNLLKKIACDHSNLKNLFLDTEKATGEKTTCDKVPGVEKLFTSRENLSPELVTQAIENYSREINALNKKAERLFRDN